MGHVMSTCECRYVVEMFKRKKTKQISLFKQLAK